MKKWFLVATVGLFLAGCGTAAQKSEYWEHSTMYKDWDHLKFSWYGYKHPSPQTAEESQERKWWGIPVESGQQ